ncbi:MurR/RpiR family transcriptional regulator [Virgibacillus sp. W0430]|uniref:MurR/RpiR family transcriptional regulator n=1 Tax=Virgibacillus sp. W0430 TaxID=3391580 RepID=UPI003F4522BC
MADMNVFKRIASYRDKMSKSQQKIANYIIENPNSVPFLTGSKLAKVTNVSEATIVRFAVFLGYSGYNELQQQLVASAEKQLNTVERLQMSRTVYNETEKAIYDIFNDDIKNIKSTMEGLNIEDVERTANYILQANKIYIVANRSAVALGSFLQYYLDIIFGKSELLQTTTTAFDRIHNVNEQDVVIAVSFARYTKSTLDVVSYAHKQQAKIIALTDYFSSPITAFADVSLFATSKMPAFLDSFVAPLSLINTLITYIGNQDGIHIDKRLESLEQLWDTYEVFYEEK